VSYIPKTTIKKAIIGLLVICVFIVIPRSLAADLLSPIIGFVEAPPESSPPTPDATPTLDPVAPVDPTLPAPPDELLNAVTDTSTPLIDEMIITDSASPTISPTPEPPHALSLQDLVLRIPNTISVDPRARSVLMPAIVVFGSRYILACVNSPRAILAIDYSDTESDSASGEALIVGSRSTNLLASGSAGQIMSILNSHSGTRVISTGPPLAGHFLTFRFVAVSEPSIDAQLCDDATLSNTRTIYFQQLGLSLEMLKGDVTLKH